MLWTTVDDNGYSTHIARSTTGKITGPYITEGALFPANMWKYDGGHGHYFTAENGQMYLVIHSPNNWERLETMPYPITTLIPIMEKDDTLVWGLTAAPIK